MSGNTFVLPLILDIKEIPSVFIISLSNLDVKSFSSTKFLV